MTKRKRIGFYYESYSNLPALVIYIQNLVRTLNEASDDEKPDIVILHRPDSPVDEIKAIGYNYISFYAVKSNSLNLFSRATNKIGRKLFSRTLIDSSDKNFPKDLDCIFPYSFQKEAAYVAKKIIWKPDFQEIHLPIYFKVSELLYDLEYIKKIESENCELVFSSEDAYRDYQRIFPSSKKMVHFWKFTSFLPDITQVNFQTLRQKYDVPGKYFLVANQFWPHKNHLCVLKAIAECKKSTGEITVVFTGKQTSARDPELYRKLLYYADLHGIRTNIRFTGFINREEQLTLMKNAIAVIQPSLFEGWSTVIEDCKALGQFVIASDLSVNREQIKNNVRFFNPYDHKRLAMEILERLNDPKTEPASNYAAEIGRFRNTLLKTLNG